jgi:hypothetical protein
MRVQLMLAALAFLGLSGAVAFSQLTESVKEEREGLLARATYSADAA